MAITSGFFNSVDGDRKYNAEQMSNYFEGLISNGVYESVGDKFVVKAKTGLNITVGTGRAMINCRWIKNDTTITLTLDAADVQYDRIDAIVLRLDLTQSVRNISVEIKKGAISSSPKRPDITRNNNIYELCLATIRVKAGTTTIKQSNITDYRSNTNLCGWVKGVVKQVDTSELFLQYQTAMEEFYESSTAQLNNILAQKTNEFNSWFTNLTESLHVDNEIVKYQNIINLTNNINTVDIGISEYEAGDVLFVHINGVMLVENEEYIVSGTGADAIITFNNMLAANNTITIICIKAEIAGSLVNNSTISKITINFGDAITITGVAKGGVEPYQYTFLCKHSTATSWTTLTSYSTTSTRVWQPTKSGVYIVRTKVKDSKGTEVIKDFTLTVNETE